MLETVRTMVEEALAVMNRAIAKSEASAVFPGASDEGDLLLTVRGANPEEDAGVALRVRNGALEIAGEFDPNSAEHPGGRWAIRLDDLQRIAAQPERYGCAPSAVAAVVTS